MSHILFKTILLVSVLTSCASTVDQTIPLSNDFEVSSKVITLENPSWRIPDSIYNINLDTYHTESSKTSWRSADRTLVNRKKDISFINYILFDDALSFITEEFEVEETQIFSFNLAKDDLLISTSKCEIFSQSLAKDTVAADIEYSNKSSNSHHSIRVKNYLPLGVVVCPLLLPKASDWDPTRYLPALCSARVACPRLSTQRLSRSRLAGS